MTVSIKLQTLIDSIMEMDHTDAEWIELDKEFEAIQNELSEEEWLLFAESGAGEALHMAVAWKRLSQGKPEDRDNLLLKHELLGSQVEKEYNISVSDAHAIATKKYDQAEAVDEMFGEDGEPDGLLQD